MPGTAHDRTKPFATSLPSWQVVALLSTTLTMGLTAGVFGDWAHTIMPGLGTADDRTFVIAFQALDRAILNPLFMLTFMGALVFTGAAGLLCVRGGDRTAGEPDRITDPAAVRDAFDESTWVAWHIVRTVATTVAFGCLAWALVRHRTPVRRGRGPGRSSRAAR
ncbi:MAG: DUF1772 domain-containing protein [Actinomycetia bacterium]|nr:DUF1772 domain-containing protein [Actinomycetes bacterium]